MHSERPKHHIVLAVLSAIVLKKWPTLKGKNFLQEGAKSFLERVGPYSKGIGEGGGGKYEICIVFFSLNACPFTLMFRSFAFPKFVQISVPTNITFLANLKA